jgi:hypothetical protein
VNQGRANKRLGASAESRCKAALMGDGYLVWKSARSLTVADLIAAKPGEWLLVQVKGGAKVMTHDDWNQLYEIARTLSSGGHGGAFTRVHAIIADWPARTSTRWGPMRLRRISGRHVSSTRTWPTEPFSTDEVEEASSARPGGGE